MNLRDTQTAAIALIHDGGRTLQPCQEHAGGPRVGQDVQAERGRAGGPHEHGLHSCSCPGTRHQVLTEFRCRQYQLLSHRLLLFIIESEIMHANCMLGNKNV